MEAPKRIYLQVWLTEDHSEWDDDYGVTWCVDRINDSDAEYVQRDVAVKLREMLDDVMYYAIDAGRRPDYERAHKLWAETAFLADSPEPALSPDVEN